MEEKKITCVICPNSCQITVKYEGENIIEVSGQKCKRGLEYASAEAIHPVRSLSTTVRCEDGHVVAVKTTKPVLKESIYDVMWEVNHFTAQNNIKYGDVIISNICDSGADIIVIGG